MTTDPFRVYGTELGTMWCGDALDVMRRMPDSSVNLVITSPPFALSRPKAYGNEVESKYVDWFMNFSWEFHRILTPDGSLVIDLGGAWMPGAAVKSLYQWRLLLALVDQIGFHLAQDFYWFNRAKMPSPAQWVTIERTRVKDAVNTLWWLSKTPNPKANNRGVLRPYSKSMRRMIERGTYNDGDRPGGQTVGKNWAKDNGGAIAPNVLEFEDRELEDVDRSSAYDSLLDAVVLGSVDNMIDQANTNSNDPYHRYCKDNNLKRHPARFPKAVPEFFIKFLTDPGDLVFDPFGGSNVTGLMAETLGRRWTACDLDSEYVAGSYGRFETQLGHAAK